MMSTCMTREGAMSALKTISRQLYELQTRDRQGEAFHIDLIRAALNTAIEALDQEKPMAKIDLKRCQPSELDPAGLATITERRMLQMNDSTVDKTAQEYENAIRTLGKKHFWGLSPALLADLVQLMADTVNAACQQTLEEEAYDYVCENPPDRGP